MQCRKPAAESVDVYLTTYTRQQPHGYRRRSLKTPVGDLELEITRLRRGTYYPESILERWSRVDASLAALAVEAYAGGILTRDMALLA